MNNADFILQNIDEMTKGINEGNNFKSDKDKAYRLEAVRQIFLGMKRDKQDRALKFMMNLLIEQKTESMQKLAAICELESVVGGTK